MQNTTRQIARGVYQQTAEMAFGLLVSAFVFSGVGFLFAVPFWLTGHINGIESLQFMGLVLVLAFFLLVFLIVKLWNKAAGFCIGMFMGAFLCGAGILLGPIK